MCSPEISEPTWVAGSIGSPIFMAPTRAASLRRNSSFTLRCTNTRVPFEHTSPAE